MFTMVCLTSLDTCDTYNLVFTFYMLQTISILAWATDIYVWLWTDSYTSQRLLREQHFTKPAEFILSLDKK